jgi:hypothetical protein
MNKIIIDGCVQDNVKLLDEVANFNIRAITGIYHCMANAPDKKRFTCVRVVYPNVINEYDEETIQTGCMVRIYGKLDSEQYTTKDGKIVYNKIICADKVVKIKFDRESQEYVEVV